MCYAYNLEEGVGGGEASSPLDLALGCSCKENCLGEGGRVRRAQTANYVNSLHY